MQLSSDAVSVFFVVAVSALLVGTGLRKQPGIGAAASVLLIAFTLWFREQSPYAIGFEPPEDWSGTILLGFAYAALLQLLAATLIGPLSEKLTGTEHDHSVFDGVRGNPRALLMWLGLVWTLVAFLEEGIFRGFLMTEIAKVAGTGPFAICFNVIFSSVVFGLAHGYQNLSGVLSTGAVGLFLGTIFIFEGFNLWLVIFVHGFVDTIGIVLIAAGADKNIDGFIRRTLWRS